MNLDKQVLEKNKFQDEIVELSKIHKFLAIEGSTGIGKALAVLKSIEALNTPLKWLVVVPETIQILNFQDEIRKHSMEHLYDKIEEIICYASLHKYEGSSYNLILNECHHLSECKTDISKAIRFDTIIADSATISEDIKERLGELGDFHYYKLNMTKAIEKGILPPPTVYTIPVVLDNYQKRNKAKFGTKVVPMTDLEYVDKLRGDLVYWKKRLKENPHEDWISRKFNTIGLERKHFFSKCKTLTLYKLLNILSKKRIAVYTGSTVQCDNLGGELAIHSGKGKKHNTEVLRKFNSGEVNRVYFHKMGREGMNLEGIEAVVIVQLSTGKDEGLEFIQTSGRAYRGLAPEIYILYIKGSKDEDFLENALENVKKEYVKELKI